VSYAFVNCFVAGIDPPEGRWSSGASLDGNGEFSTVVGEPSVTSPCWRRRGPTAAPSRSKQAIDIEAPLAR
jgi:hypothetical protein